MWSKRLLAVDMFRRFIILLLISLFMASASRAEAGSDIAKSAPCLQWSQHPSRHIFWNLKGVNVYVMIPTNYWDAIECHGREDECMRHSSSFGNPSSESKYVQDIKEKYNSYPKALLPEAIEAIAVPEVQKNLGKYVSPDSECRVPPVKVLHHEHPFPDTTSNGLEAIYNPGTVTITIAIQFIDLGKAMLTSTMFRPDIERPSYEDSIATRVALVDLDKGDAAIKEQIEGYLGTLPSVRLETIGKVEE
jgi:hypothetical protein